jgi:putative ABC transport system permease protein
MLRPGRHRFYTLLNAAGLALGMACCLLIALFVRGEQQVDTFHPDSDRLFRVSQWSDGPGTDLWAWTGGGMGPDLVADFPQIEHLVRVARSAQDVFVPGADGSGGSAWREEGLLFADEAFFEVFGFELVHGDPAHVLDAPDAVVVTQSTAERFFGTADPVGRQIVVQGTHALRVTGVAQDPPPGTQMRFDLVGGPGAFRTLNGFSGEYTSYWWPTVYTYVRLHDAADAPAVQAELADFAIRHRGEESGGEHPPVLENIDDLYLYSPATGALGETGSLEAVRTFGFIALAILLLAAINFVNLTTARAQTRAQEVGVRKAVGAGRGELVGRFLGESVVLSVAALGLGAFVAWAGLPLLEGVTGRALDVGALVTPGLVLSALGLAVVVGLLAGVYPAFVLSSFEPVRVLRGTRTAVEGGGRGLTLRRVLVGTQFAVSIALVAATLVALQQNRFLRSADLGFDNSRTVAVQIKGEQGWPALRDALQATDGVESVTASSARPGLGATFGLPYRVSGDGRPQMTDSENPEGGGNLQFLYVTDDFDEQVGLELLAGRLFGPNFPGDVGTIPEASRESPFLHLEGRGLIVNETAARRHGWTPDEALGKHYRLFAYENGTYYTDISGTVVGVVRDFHVGPLGDHIEPLLLMRAESPRGFSAGWALVKVAPGDAGERMDALRATFRSVAPDAPFVASFLDAALDERYAEAQRTGTLLGAFGALGLAIACLGLFGLVAYAAQSRRREIGVRKVLGAGVGRITWLLLRDFALLALVAALIALPLAWWASGRWLSTFAYHTDLDPLVFVLAALAVAVVALATVAAHALRAATADPTAALRAE